MTDFKAAIEVHDATSGRTSDRPPLIMCICGSIKPCTYLYLSPKVVCRIADCHCGLRAQKESLMVVQNLLCSQENLTGTMKRPCMFNTSAVLLNWLPVEGESTQAIVPLAKTDIAEACSCRDLGFKRAP